MGEDEKRTPYYNIAGERVNNWSEDSRSYYHNRDDNVEEKYDKETGDLVSQTYDGATYDPYGNLMDDDDDDDGQMILQAKQGIGVTEHAC